MVNSGTSEKQNFPLLRTFKEETDNVCFQLLSGRQRSGLDECLRFSSVLSSCRKLEEKVCHPEEWGKSHELSDRWFLRLNSAQANYNPLRHSRQNKPALIPPAPSLLSKFPTVQVGTSTDGRRKTYLASWAPDLSPAPSPGNGGIC